MKRSLIVILVLAIAIYALSPIVAEAACTLEAGLAHVDRVAVYPGASNSAIYFRPYSLTNYYYVCYTTDSKLIDAALNALTSRTNVIAQGNAASCPTSGSERFMGACTLITVSP